MTSDEITAKSGLFMSHEGVLNPDHASACWLREIALQLALLNEANKRRDIRSIQDTAQQRKDAGVLGHAEPGKTEIVSEPGESFYRRPYPEQVAIALTESLAHTQPAKPEFVHVPHGFFASLAHAQPAKTESVSEPGEWRIGFPVDEDRSVDRSQGSRVSEPSSATSPSPKCLNCAGYADAIEGQLPVVICRACGRKTAEPEGSWPRHREPVPLVPEASYPYVAKYGSRWGLWIKAGHPLRTFDSEEEAKQRIRDVAERINEQ